jgi:hypothetical protein
VVLDDEHALVEFHREERVVLGGAVEEAFGHFGFPFETFVLVL